MSRTEIVSLLDDVRYAGRLVDERRSSGGSVDETSVLAMAEQRVGGPPSDQLRELFREFVAGHKASA